MFNELDFIERKNGYLDIDHFLKLNKDNAKILSKDNEDFFRFEVNGIEYMLKYTDEASAVKEILASEMLEYVGIEHASYDFAYHNGSTGVITRNLKKDWCSYISGDELIENYYAYIDSNFTKKNKKIEERFNNLSDIWDMLEINYSYHPNKNNIVKNIMYKLTEKFMFDILTGQWDGAAHNWIIEQTDNYATLFPLHDNEKMLNGLNLTLNTNMNLKVEESSKNITQFDYASEIRKFIQYSDEVFVNEFKNLLSTLTPNNIKYMLIGIENNTNKKINFKVKEEIISIYKYLHHELSKILNEELLIKR